MQKGRYLQITLRRLSLYKLEVKVNNAYLVKFVNVIYIDKFIFRFVWIT
jgi:hypothetical protein